MPYHAVLFDLDGTLLDTLEDLGDAMNRVLAKKGFPTHHLEAYRYFIGEGTPMLITRAIPEKERTDDMIRTCLEAFLEDYGQNWNVKTKPFEGVPEMLSELASRGLKMAVLSNKSHEFTTRCVAHLLKKWNFHVIIGQRDGIPRKPNPFGALEVSERLNIPPSQCLYLGDSGIDMKTALAAGMFPVGVLWGFRTAEELVAFGAQALIKRPMDIANLLT